MFKLITFGYLYFYRDPGSIDSNDDVNLRYRVGSCGERAVWLCIIKFRKGVNERQCIDYLDGGIDVCGITLGRYQTKSYSCEYLDSNNTRLLNNNQRLFSH